MEVCFDLVDRDDGRIVLNAASCPKELDRRQLEWVGCKAEDLFNEPSMFSLWEKGKAFRVAPTKDTDSFGIEVDGWTLIDKGFEITTVVSDFSDLKDFDEE